MPKPAPERWFPLEWKSCGPSSAVSQWALVVRETQRVTVAVYDALGRRVRVVGEEFAASRQVVVVR